MNMDNSVIIAVERGLKGINGNRKHTIKIKIK